MRNTILLLAIALTLGAFAGMMRVKTDVQTMDNERRRLVNERAGLRETKRVLEAEWALLVSPERLQKMIVEAGYVPGSSLSMESLIPPPSPTLVVSASVTAVPVSPSGVSKTLAPISWPQ